MAIDAAAEAVANAVSFLLQNSHLFVAGGLDEVVEVLVRKSEEHGGGKDFEVFDDLQM